MNLILLQPDAVDSSGRATLTAAQAGHVRTVLRAAVGDTVRIGLLDGPRGVGTVRSVAEDAVELDCVFESESPPRLRVDLLLALPRPKVLKRLWAQISAMGVDRIILTNAARVERNYFDTHVIDPAFFTPLLIEGLQQAQDTRLPRVSIHRRFRPLIEDELPALSDASERLVLHPGAGVALLAGAPRGTYLRVLLAIGPEGGWVPYELEQLAAHGFRPVHMGARALRSDTACIAALAVVAEALREHPGS